MTAELNFVRQQGLRAAPPQSCVHQYPALIWRPRAIGILVVVGLVVQAWSYFLALGALLWWNVAFPDLNPFDALYAPLVANPAAPDGPSAESPPVRASHGGDLYARDRGVPILWLAHTRVGSRRISARRSSGPDLRPLLPGLIPLFRLHRASWVREQNASVGS